MSSNEICHVGPTSFHSNLGNDAYPVEDNRYWLYTSKICPFAHRTEIVRKLKGLEDVVGLTIAAPVLTAEGWNLAERYESEDSAPNPVADMNRLPGIYELAAPGYSGRASVPVLFDRQTNTIVNNESAEIIRQFDMVFSQGAASPELYPETQREDIDEVCRVLGEDLISPIYRAGFAQDQETYQKNFDSVFTALDMLETRLAASGPYLLGETLSLADVHAFPHVARFDAVYHSLYRLNFRFIRDYPRLSAYMERLADIPAFSSTLDVAAAKEGYFRSWNQPTEGTFTPSGPPVDLGSGILVRGDRRALA